MPFLYCRSVETLETLETHGHPPTHTYIIIIIFSLICQFLESGGRLMLRFKSYWLYLTFLKLLRTARTSYIYIYYIIRAYTVRVQDNSLRLADYMLHHYPGHPGDIYLSSSRIGVFLVPTQVMAAADSRTSHELILALP